MCFTGGCRGILEGGVEPSKKLCNIPVFLLPSAPFLSLFYVIGSLDLKIIVHIQWSPEYRFIASSYLDNDKLEAFAKLTASFTQFSLFCCFFCNTKVIRTSPSIKKVLKIKPLNFNCYTHTTTPHYYQHQVYCSSLKSSVFEFTMTVNLKACVHYFLSVFLFFHQIIALQKL